MSWPNAVLLTFVTSLTICCLPLEGQGAPRTGPHGIGVDLMFGLLGTVESNGKIEPADLDGPLGFSLSYEHDVSSWLQAGPRVIWSLSEAGANGHDFSNVHLGLQAIPTWKFHRKAHLFALVGAGGTFINRNDGGRDRTGWGHHWLMGIGSKLVLRGMHVRMSLNHVRAAATQIESEESFGQPFRDRDIQLEYTSLALGIVF